MKLTREQVEGRKAKAVRFVRDVLGDPDRAAEIEDESVDDYAERRKFQIVENPRRKSPFIVEKSPRGDGSMAKTRAELEERVKELEEENDELQDALDQIADLAAPPEEEEEGEGEEEGEDQGED